MFLARYFRHQISEIEQDPVLRIYGALMCLTVILSCLYWFSIPMGLAMSSQSEAFCWPMLRDCHRFRIFDESQIKLLYTLLIATSLINGLLFLSRRTVKGAYGFLILNHVFKFGLMALDFRSVMNQHYMAAFACFTFLFVPSKRDSLRILIVFFYLWAGALKFNGDWLSGADLSALLWLIPEDLLTPACYYVIVLEMVLIWGLWSRRKGWYWGTFAQLVVFHLVSWSVVGFFYPLLMFCILSIYPLLGWQGAESVGERLRSKKRPYLQLLPALVLSLLQLPRFFLGGDTALTGEGRVFALNMFDALTFCEVTATIHSSNPAEGDKVIPLFFRELGTRIQCDPIIYYNRARTLCREHSKDPAFADLDLRLTTRRASQRKFHLIVDQKGFCAKNPDYTSFFKNEWIEDREL